jgi:predicted metal-dependent hydrolase
MTERWKINDYDVEIRRRAHQRTLRLRVTPKGELRVTCAKTVPKREIFHFVSSNEKFISQQLREFEKIREMFPAKQFVDGETLLFLGKERNLYVRPGGNKLKLFMEGEHFILTGKSQSENERREAVRRFFRNCGRKYLAFRLEFYVKAMGLKPAKVSFRSQTSRWGSCTGEGHISLNWRLIAAPPEVLDYVVVHELAHLKHHDHSKRFWALVGEFSPRYRELKDWLNDHQWALEFLSPAKEEV